MVTFVVIGLLALLSSKSLTAQPSPKQTIRGEVVDKVSHAALPGANVFILNSDPLIGTTSSADGSFVLEDIPLGRHDIQVSYLGFEPKIVSQVLVTSARETVVEIALEERVVVGEEVVVTARSDPREPINDLAYVSARRFSVEQTRRYAGGLDDPARMASAFAGVSTGGGVENNAMVIRGNSPKGVLWRLEGVDIPNPNHFAGLSVAGGGGVTLFSSQMLSDSDFITGSFPAEYGNALAGVFDMNFRTGNPERHEHTLQAGLLGIDVASEGPISRAANSTYLFNYRYSTLGLLLPLLPTEDVARYQDLAYKISVRTRKMGRFEFWGLGGLDSQTTSATEDSSAWEFETWDRIESSLKLGTGAAGLSHRVILGGRSFLNTTVGATLQKTNLVEHRINDDLVLDDHLQLRNSDKRYVVNSFLNRKWSRRHSSRTGFTVQRLMYDLDIAAATSNERAAGQVASADGHTHLVQLYTQSTFDVSSRLSVNAGVHVQHFELNRVTAIEPRAGLSWNMDMRQSLSIGYGRHSQVEDLRIYFARPESDVPSPNKSLDLAKAHHFVIAYNRSLSESVRLDVEGYYQRLFDVPVIPDSSFSLLNFEQDLAFADVLVNSGAGENYGVETTVERIFAGGFYYLLTATVFESRYRGGDGLWRPTRFDRSATANGLLGKEFTLRHGNLIGVNVRAGLAGGRRTTPVDTMLSVASEEVVYQNRQAFGEREPAGVVIDLTTTYRRNHRSFSEVWALQIKNMLGATTESHDYNFATRRVETVKEGFPLPVLSYKIEF